MTNIPNPLNKSKMMSLADMFLLESAMYNWHLREINAKPNYGWNRTQYYSIGQQLVRQAPMYWEAYVYLRENHLTHYIAYPYYTKYAQSGDSTAFRHIDNNIAGMLEQNRGKLMIQGSLSFHTEGNTGCTELIPGFHRIMDQWYKEKKSLIPGGKVHKFDKTLWGPAEVQKYGMDFKPVPCKAGQVRISESRLPHGATTPHGGKADQLRSTYLPWFIAIQDDHETLELVEGGTWGEIAANHRDLEAPLRTPSGHPNKYGRPPYRFGAAVELVSAPSLTR